jgi:hypothetical protein
MIFCSQEYSDLKFLYNDELQLYEAIHVDIYVGLNHESIVVR